MTTPLFPIEELIAIAEHRSSPNYNPMLGTIIDDDVKMYDVYWTREGAENVQKRSAFTLPGAMYITHEYGLKFYVIVHDGKVVATLDTRTKTPSSEG